MDCSCNQSDASQLSWRKKKSSGFMTEAARPHKISPPKARNLRDPQKVQTTDAERRISIPSCGQQSSSRLDLIHSSTTALQAKYAMCFSHRTGERPRNACPNPQPTERPFNLAQDSRPRRLLQRRPITIFPDPRTLKTSRSITSGSNDSQATYHFHPHLPHFQDGRRASSYSNPPTEALCNVLTTPSSAACMMKSSFLRQYACGCCHKIG